MTPELLSEAGAVAVISFLLVLVVRYLLRDMTQAIESIARQVRANTMSVLALMDMIIRHDATVRGVNPSTGVTDDERFKNAVEVYEAILREIQNLQLSLRRNGDF